MAFVFTFLLIAGLEIAAANDDQTPEPIAVEIPEEPDMCVGCDGKVEEPESPPQLTVEVRIDPITGEILYVIKGIVIE
jgi:Uma2 family endonuclease